MNIKNLKKHEVVVYLIATFLFTWLFWSISFAACNPILNGFFHIAGAFMPSVMAIIFTGYFYGKKAIKELFKKLTIWKVNPLFYLFIFLYTAAAIYLPAFICTGMGLDYNIQISNQLWGFSLSSPITILVCFLVAMIFGGPVGEELGWRGFVLPKLQKKFSPLIASIILGTIWACWHLPMFFVHFAGYDISFGRYLLETIWLTILFTWLYNHTKGSLLIPILYHSIDNFMMALCYNNFMNSFNSYTAIWYIIRLIVLGFIIFDMTRKSSPIVSE